MSAPASPKRRFVRVPGKTTLHHRHSIDVLVRLVLAPVAAAVVIASYTSEGASFEVGVLAFLAFLSGAWFARREPRWASLLSTMRLVLAIGAPLIGVSLLVLLKALSGLPEAEWPSLAIAFLASAGLSLFPQLAGGRYWVPRRTFRVGVIGSRASAESLFRELELSGARRYRVVGRVHMPNEKLDGADTEVPNLGDLDALGSVVSGHGIDLLVMTGEVPRLSVFDEMAHSCLHLPVWLWELSGFYEEVFGHVPVAEINASWFQYILHPKYRASAPASKRALDLLLAVVGLLVSLPMLLALAAIIRRDGGPALFRQRRIGEGGRSFTLYKLRTMRLGASSAAQWASPDDERITGIGGFLRRTHLDELPQLFNVIQGEMSLVGPRPEQPEFVDRLEAALPFYSRRHLVKPGITGWAQVRCGYAGSDIGSAWKLCHDLYYLKHRSPGFDLLVLAETLRMLFREHAHAVEPRAVPFILGSDPTGATEVAGALGAQAHQGL